MARRPSRSSRPKESPLPPESGVEPPVPPSADPAESSGVNRLPPASREVEAEAEAPSPAAEPAEPSETAETDAVEGAESGTARVAGELEAGEASSGSASPSDVVDPGAAGTAEEPGIVSGEAAPAAAAGFELKWVLESLLFAAQKPLTAKELKDLLVLAAEDPEAPEAQAFRKVRESDITPALETLQAEHEAAGRTYRLQCVAETWQFASVPRYAPWLRALLGRKARPSRLSQPAIETLTIIAYRQPVTRAEIEQIRGVAVDGVMQTLLERGLVEGVGRAEVIGRPVIYGTTPLFLEYFGLRSLEDLPSADELRRIPVQRPDVLATVDPGLATAPADAPQAVVDLAQAEAPAPSAAPPAPPATPAPGDGGDAGAGSAEAAPG